MDTYLAITSKRDQRDYDDRPVPKEVERRILEAGRMAGSAANRQSRRFIVVSSEDAVERLAETTYAPATALGAALVIAIVTSGKGPTEFDAGRAAQNMMLAAWNDGVTSCPNGMPDRSKAAHVLGLPGGEEPAIVLTFGYPARARDPESRSPEEWVERANRKPHDEVVERR